MKPTIALVTAMAGIAAISMAAPTAASTFTPGTIVAVAPDDALNIRKWPAAYSRIIDAYGPGSVISMTGRCRNIVTNRSFRIDGRGSVKRKYRRMKRAYVWCQVMTDSAEIGWARGRYIWPN